MLTQQYPFTESADYNFGAEIEIAGGAAALKSQVPAGATFGANYDAGINANWGNGSIVGTAANGCTVSGGKLLCDGTVSAKYVSYPAAGNVASNYQTGAIRFKLTPNFTTSPGQDIGYFSISYAANDTRNLIQLDQGNGNPTTYLRIYSSTGVSIVLGGYALGLSNGVECEIEINYDLTSGATRLFKNGVQLGSTITATGTRSGTIGLFHVGSSYDLRRSNFYIDDFEVFSSVQHTENYTPGYSVPPKYAVTNPTVKPVQALTMDALSSFAATVTGVGGDSVKYTLEVNGVEKYWTGTAWESSNGYAQSNTAAEILANAATAITSGKTVRFTAYLHSNDGTTTPSLDNIAIVYNYWGGSASSPDVCTVFGHLYDAEGLPISGATVRATISGYAISNSGVQILNKDITKTTDANGYWEMDLVKSTKMTPNRIYRFAFKTGDTVKAEKKTIPDQAYVNYGDL